jgi:hypothetical protein
MLYSRHINTCHTDEYVLLFSPIGSKRGYYRLVTAIYREFVTEGRT